MYATSDYYNALIAVESHWFECRVAINGSSYGEDQILEMESDYRMFSENQPGVGGCLAGELTLRMLAPNVEIPRMATVNPYVRVWAQGYQDPSEWIPQGKYFIDTRETTDNNDGLPILSLHCYDAMLKAEADYPNTTHNWPYSDWNVVKEISYFMGLSQTPSGGGGVDPRTRDAMNKGYMIGLPLGYSMREVLSHIAAMYGGNWVMSYDGKLLLVKLTDLPPETNYLVTIAGDPITFGGDRILV